MNICFIGSFIDFTTSVALINRIDYLYTEKVGIEVLCYGDANKYLSIECSKRNIHMEILSQTDLDFSIIDQGETFLASWTIYKKLKKRHYDQINFLDFKGVGFHCIQAKRMNLAFISTKLNVLMQGASQYINELSEEWGCGGINQLLEQYMERYACQYCDELIVSTNGLVEWALNRKWILCPVRTIIPFNTGTNDNFIQIPDDNNQKMCLIFYGYLEKKGGLHVFLEALKKIFKDHKSNIIEKVLFVGELNKKTKILNTTVDIYIKEQLSKLGYKYEILSIYEPAQLLEIAKKNNGYLVFAEIMSINSVELVSSIAGDINMFVSSNVAHRELFEEDTLFNPYSQELSGLIINRKVSKPKKNQLYCQHLSVVNESVNINSNMEYPLVSICTAFYNHGIYLDMLRKSIENQDYPNIEWIIVDDGSTDKLSLDKLDEYEMKYKDRQYHILHQDNAGPSIARNRAVECAKGQYIIFTDADNVAKPSMVSSFVHALNTSGADCLSCYFEYFHGNGEVNELSLDGRVKSMVGECLELGAFINLFGDTNFIIKRDVFNEIGGFLPQRVVTEDWQILTKVALSKFKMDVIPEALFWYRVLGESNINHGSEFYKQHLIMQTYGDTLPPYLFHLLISFCRPIFENERICNEINSQSIFKKLVNFVLPYESKRRKIVKKVLRK